MPFFAPLTPRTPYRVIRLLVEVAAPKKKGLGAAMGGPQALINSLNADRRLRRPSAILTVRSSRRGVAGRAYVTGWLSLS